MKFATSVWNDASQGVPIPPPGSATPTPNVLNQPRSDWSVAKTTAQNIHFVKPPPIMKVLLLPSQTDPSQHEREQGGRRSQQQENSYNVA